MKIMPGFRVGHLSVVSDSGERKNGYIVWNCQCDCGNQIRVDKRTLQRGTVTDCGCISRVKPGCRDITGERFGMLIAQYPTGKVVTGGAIWHCVCDCGGETEVSLGKLTTGHRKSCGCLSHPPLKAFIGKRFGALTVTAYAGKKGGMHIWRCLCDCGKETTVGQTLLQTGRTRSCGCIRNEKLKERLKLVDGTSIARLEKSLTGQTSRANTSGHVGVYPLKNTGRWVSQIGFKGKNYYLGTFDTKTDAIRAREKAEEMYSDFVEWYYKKYLPTVTLSEKAEIPAVFQEADSALSLELRRRAYPLKKVEET